MSHTIHLYKNGEKAKDAYVEEKGSRVVPHGDYDFGLHTGRVGGITMGIPLAPCFVLGDKIPGIADTTPHVFISTKAEQPPLVLSLQGARELVRLLEAAEADNAAKRMSALVREAASDGFKSTPARGVGIFVDAKGQSTVVPLGPECVTHGVQTHALESHRGCAVVDEAKKVVCPCDCTDCKRAWEAEGRPRYTRSGKLERMP